MTKHTSWCYITLSLNHPDALPILRTALENYVGLTATLRDAADTNAAGLAKHGEAKEAARSTRRAEILAERNRIARALAEQVTADPIPRATGDE